MPDGRGRQRRGDGIVVRVEGDVQVAAALAPERSSQPQDRLLMRASHMLLCVSPYSALWDTAFTQPWFALQAPCSPGHGHGCCNGAKLGLQGGWNRSLIPGSLVQGKSS